MVVAGETVPGPLRRSSTRTGMPPASVPPPDPEAIMTARAGSTATMPTLSTCCTAGGVAITSGAAAAATLSGANATSASKEPARHELTAATTCSDSTASGFAIASRTRRIASVQSALAWVCGRSLTI